MADYEDSLRRRLGIIEGLGQDRTRHFSEKRSRDTARAADRQAQIEAQQAQMEQAMSSRLDAIGNLGGSTRVLPRAGTRGGPRTSPRVAELSRGGGGGFDAFANAIIQQESGGNYNARNRSSGALGRYQIMPGNIASWSRGALGRSISANEFMRNPQLQDQIARWQLNNYFKQYGASGAAVAWYAGPGNANKYVKNPSGWNKPQKGAPSIADYVASIRRRMGI